MNEELCVKAFRDLFDKEPSYTFKVEYGHLKEYNAYVIKSFKTITFKLSKRWLNISPMIKIGLFQSLLIKLFRRSKKLKARKTTSLEVYNNFVKGLYLSVEKKKFDPILEESFIRVNKTYFNGSMDKPNLRFGRPAFVKLASYNFHNDTVTVSSIFKDAPNELLDLLMYHELLHKKLKFSGSLLKRFHTYRFRSDEKKFKNYEIVDEELEEFVRKKMRNRKF